jgi:UPF0755 protein
MNKTLTKSLFPIAIGTIILVFLYILQIYLPLSNNSQESEFFIKKGQSVSTIANNLKENGLIRNTTLFKGYIWLIGDSLKLQSGRYLLNEALSLKDIINKFVIGDTSGLEITIVEGWDVKDITDYLNKLNICSKEEFLEAMNDFSSSDYPILNDKPTKTDLEGYIFPDTYKLGDDFSAQVIIQKTLSNLDKKIAQDLKDEIIKQKKSIFEILIMASLIEKEVITKTDKAIVSGILWKRLGSGMPLQVDATINYLSGRQGILHEDLAIDSPYNTYKYAGLPPGPICNPGLDSIVAAIYPQNSTYWYYLSKPDKTTVFSKTLGEHNIARAKYLK